MPIGIDSKRVLHHQLRGIALKSPDNPGTTTTTATVETTANCNYGEKRPSGYNPPDSAEHFGTVGGAPLPGGGTLEVKFRAITEWRNWRSDENGRPVCDLVPSISEVRTPGGIAIFAASNGNLNCRRSMKSPLDKFANTINHFSSQCGTGYGMLQTIGHGGGQRPRNSCSAPYSYHCDGSAIDIYWLEWNGGAVSRPCNGADEAGSSLAAYRRLVAVEAGLRRCFGYVLGRNISLHQNHFHADSGCGIALRLKSGTTNRTFTSCNYFIQDCVLAFVDYDDDEQSAKPVYGGPWDEVSKTGYLRLLSDFGMSRLDPVRYVHHYMIFLDFVMMHGFANRHAGAYRWGRVPVL